MQQAAELDCHHQKLPVGLSFPFFLFFFFVINNCCYAETVHNSVRMA